MKKILTAFLFATILILSSCGTSKINSAEMEKIPADFPLNNAPICNISEFISYTDKTVADQYSAEIVYNSDSEYNDIVEFYKKAFPEAVCTDFGTSYNLINVMTLGQGHLVSVRISQKLNSGEKGTCTVIISATEQ